MTAATWAIAVPGGVAVLLAAVCVRAWMRRRAADRAREAVARARANMPIHHPERLTAQLDEAAETLLGELDEALWPEEAS